jgi:hypothetical protein
VGAVGLGLGHGGNKNMRLDSWGSELSEGRGELECRYWTRKLRYTSSIPFLKSATL